MAVTYVINFHIQPERRDDFLQLLQSVLDAMRSEPMFREAVLHRDPASEDRFMLYETWESHEDVLNVQLHRPYRRAWHEALPHLMARDRDMQSGSRCAPIARRCERARPRAAEEP